MAFEEIGGQLAHLPEKPQITLLCACRGVAALKYFHHSHCFQVGFQQSENQKEIGGIAGLLTVFRAGMRRHQHPLAAGKNFVQQPAVLGLSFLLSRSLVSCKLI